VFLVEHNAAADVYSNGLRILADYETTGAPRAYRAFDRATSQLSERETQPAGIVFHTTESLVLPIEAGQELAINRTRGDLLSHVKRDRLYNFVIDRLGQVYRVVPEDQIANHAGNSVWADSKNIFIDLNDSFLGVAFQLRAGEETTAAQRHSGKLLTELLRGAYRIADGNCVTHAQVSVNPSNFRIGYHTDWGSGFPFEAVGLAIGYRSHVAAVEVFGFGYDEHLVAALGGRPWEGLLAAEQQILIDAAAHGILSPRYRTNLQQQFQNLRRRKNEKNE
jgi:hypothetical protein